MDFVHDQLATGKKLREDYRAVQNRRDSSRRWMKVQWQVTVGHSLRSRMNDLLEAFGDDEELVARIKANRGSNRAVAVTEYRVVFDQSSFLRAKMIAPQVKAPNALKLRKERKIDKATFG